MKLAVLCLLLFGIIIVRATSSPSIQDRESENIDSDLSAQILEGNQLSLCSEIPQNVFLLLDLSGSIQGKAKLRRFDYQRRYVEMVLDEFSAAASTLVRFGISAYSRYAAHVRSLKNSRSSDTSYMKNSIKTFKKFSRGVWDSRNGYKKLTKKGNRYSHIETALKAVDDVLASVSGDPAYGTNTTVILFTDGRPENFRFRNRQKGKKRFSDKQEFWNSLRLVIQQRERERNMYDPSLFHVHCAMMVTGTYYSDVFIDKICDTYEKVNIAQHSIAAGSTVQVETCSSIGSSDTPTLSPTSTPTRLPSISLSPTDSPVAAPTRAPSQSPELSPPYSPSAAPTEMPSISPSLSPSNSPSESPSRSPSSSPTTLAAAPSTSTLGPSTSPTTTPTNAPTDSPSSSTSAEPTTSTSLSPSSSLSTSPSYTPSDSPSSSPSSSPSTLTGAPTLITLAPSTRPALAPSGSPTGTPSATPTESTTSSPSTERSVSPSTSPSSSPSFSPSSSPMSSTIAPSQNPTTGPSVSPTTTPKSAPSTSPTSSPSTGPTTSPSISQSSSPSVSPTLTTSSSPSASPTGSPTSFTAAPSQSPWSSPSESPTPLPSSSPTTSQSTSPTAMPSASPVSSPSSTPTHSPSIEPSMSPTVSPSGSPSVAPTKSPPTSPSMTPTNSPSSSPSRTPTNSPSMSSSGTPTPSPSIAPSMSPTASPSVSPSGVPTKSPSTSPSISPINSPSNSPSRTPTNSPSTSPTLNPTSLTDAPTSSTLIPSQSPSNSPSESPTPLPSSSPSRPPSVSPTAMPSPSPSTSPILNPSVSPTQSPTVSPTVSPSSTPTGSPQTAPTVSPSISPSGSPTDSPTSEPSSSPSNSTTISPSASPVMVPTGSPTTSPFRTATSVPTSSPSHGPSTSPTESPSSSPSISLTHSPSKLPSASPSTEPSASPTAFPSNSPTTSPEASPTISPTTSPSMSPSISPSTSPSVSPSLSPSNSPTTSPTISPSGNPSFSPSAGPSMSPSNSPSTSPTTTPSLTPSKSPTTMPTSSPSLSPTASPTASPSLSPTESPTFSPTVSPIEYATCNVTTVDTFEDVGRDSNESLIEPIVGADFQITCNVDLTRFDSFTSFDLATTDVGEFYFGGAKVSTVPGSSFTSDGAGEFSLSGLSFVPFADKAEDVVVSHTMNTVRSDTLAPFTTDFDQYIFVCKIADIPAATIVETCVTTYEDEAAIFSFVTSLNDNDGSESITVWRASVDSPVSDFKSFNGVEVTTAKMEIPTVCNPSCDDYTVLAGEDFSGNLELSIEARSNEIGRACLTQRYGYSAPPQAITLRVLPVPDLPEIVPLSNTRLLEDERLSLAPRINFAPSRDRDGSEEHFLIVVESSLPTGASIYVNDVLQTPMDGIFEIASSDIDLLTLQPPPHSNEDFTLILRGKTVDAKDVVSCSGVLENFSNTTVSGDIPLPIELKGVADPPIFADDNWTVSTSGDGTVVSRALEEDAPLMLDINITSGESSDSSPVDGSETLSIVIAVPNSITFANSSFVTYIGTSGAGISEYEVAAEDIAKLRLVLPDHQTTDFELEARVVVTENDGNSLTEPFTIQLAISPKIDAVDYEREVASEDCTRFAEDAPAFVNILPLDFVDFQERVVGVKFTGLPSGYDALVESTSVSNDAEGVYTLSAAQVDRVANHGINLEILSSLNNDSNPELFVTVTVEQQDADSATTVLKDIQGVVLVRLRGVPESDGVLLFEDSAGTPVTSYQAVYGQPVTLGDPKLVFKSTDTSSLEDIGALTLEFPGAIAKDFYVGGAVFDGSSRWVITNGEFKNVTLSALVPPGSSFDISAVAEIYDYGSPAENETSCPMITSVGLTLNYTIPTSPGTCLTQAGDIMFVPTTVRGDEDTLVSFGNQLDLSVDATDAAYDVTSIVFPSSTLSAFPALELEGGSFEFSTGDYIVTASVQVDGRVDLSNFNLLPPANWAGDFELNFTIVSFDTLCGDVKKVDVRTVLELEPKIEAPVLVTLQALDSATEDKSINLTLVIDSLADQQPKTLGQEVLSNFDVTVDPLLGSVTIVQVEEAAGFALFTYTPAPDFSGEATFEIHGKLTDTAVFDLSGSVERFDTITFTESITIQVAPVCDTASFYIPSNLNSTEDGRLNLESIVVTPGDADGSESFVSLVLSNVPEGFAIGSPAVSVGLGQWLIVPINGEIARFVMRLPQFFSGVVTLELSANMREAGADIAESCTTNEQFNVSISPVPDQLVSAVQTVYSGAEDTDITLNLGLSVQDDMILYGSSPNVVENPPETIRAVFSNVPLGATISAGTGATSVQTNDTTWQVDTTGTVLNSVTFNSGKNDGSFSINMLAKSIDNGVELAYGLSVNTDLAFTLSGVNEPPINTFPSTVPLGNGTTIISSLAISDLDSYDREFRIFFTTSWPAVLEFVDMSGQGELQFISQLPGEQIFIRGNLDAVNNVIAAGIRYSSNTPGSIEMNTRDRVETRDGTIVIDTITIA